ncbi:MAG: bifunctional UDP-3-O-[3-hydroxymyristoyl] N-acetylglucosamine deacetylase/3-hydroxyacyl-ACP dehydratase [Bacteroidales bacterium]|nr:bifunctional UDP-3-O-[3-hydroxymyristoyl] N-acetylglucosamine deacetylase/3-hydroxyacyl-ACP dehydratase [Bacteroidales bacterium]
MEYQTTLKSEIKKTGKGLHTGKTVTVTVKPADACNGVVFKRTDLENPVTIPANVDYVSDTSRSTTLAIGEAKIATVEHLLSALSGMKVDNAIIEVEGGEIPILDGSASIWVEEIKKAGIVELPQERTYTAINENICYNNEKDGVEMIVVPSDDFKVTVVIDYKTQVLGEQIAQLSESTDYAAEVAQSRTFVFIDELEFLLANNLIKGGDMDNALVFVNKQLSDSELQHLAKLFNKDITNLQVKEGILNNVQKHFDNEPARHKLLDFLGDISLVGKNLKGHFMIKRPGHTSNVAFAKAIKKHLDKIAKVPKQYDLSKPPVYDILAIKKLLPHRYPFLLIDKIVEIGDDYVVGVKNVTTNEPFFQGHFPNQPVMPGVLQIEAMAQVGGVLVLKDVPDPENYSTFFLTIDNVKFRKLVVPGDTLVLELKLTEPMRRGIIKMQGYAYVGQTLVCEALLMAQVSKQQK